MRKRAKCVERGARGTGRRDTAFLTVALERGVAEAFRGLAKRNGQSMSSRAAVLIGRDVAGETSGTV
jgi:hypothetical protein